MAVLITIGELSRMTHLSVKALRHYHDLGLLEPVEIDRSSGYRFYSPGQIPVAQMIRRFRDLNMPVDEVRSMLQAPDEDARNRVIISHLQRMEDQLAATSATVASLRSLLENPAVAAALRLETAPSVWALVVEQPVTLEGLVEWWQEAFTDLRNRLAESGLERCGPDTALYPAQFFEEEHGVVSAYIPVTGEPAGIPGTVEIPGARLAVMTHEGTLEDLDRTYGALGTVVAEKGNGTSGPIRESYIVSPLHGGPDDGLRTDVGWPVLDD